MCKCNKPPCGCTFSYEVQITELQQWLRDHPDASIEAVREVRRKLTELDNNQSQINDKR